VTTALSNQRALSGAIGSEQSGMIDVLANCYLPSAGN
jgi:hypothetical protein